MKKYFVLLFMGYSIYMFSQTGYDYLNRFPALPGPKCITDTIEVNTFNRALWKLTEDLDSACKLRRERLEARIEELKPNVEKNIAQEYGISNAELQKLKNKKLSKEEKKKIADQMMQNKANISMAEIEQLKKMKKEGNKEGIQNWADAYSTQKMAELTSGDSTKTPEQIEMEKDLSKNKKVNDLMKEQKDLVDRIDAVNKKYANKIIEFNKEDSVQTVILNRAIKPLEKMLTEDNLSGDQRRGIEIEIATHRLNYCNKISPMYMDIIRDARYSIEPLLPVYDKLEIVNAELNAATLGLAEWPTDPGLMQLEAVRGLAHTIASIFKYTIIPPGGDY